MAEVEDVHLAGLPQACVDRREGAGLEDVVPVEEQQIAPGRRFRPGASGHAQAAGRRRGERNDPVVPLGVRAGDRARRGAGGVADRDQLEVAERLGEDGVQRLGQPAGDAESGDDDAEAGHSALSLGPRLLCRGQCVGEPVVSAPAVRRGGR
jgi:hypothetical protein